MIVNEEYIKEYEEMSLCDFADELVEPLNNVKKDLTKIIYIHYAEERDKNYKLEEKNARLKDKIEKTIMYIENTYDDVVSSFTEDKPMTNFKARKELLEILKEN